MNLQNSRLLVMVKDAAGLYMQKKTVLQLIGKLKLSKTNILLVDPSIQDP